MPVAKGYKTFIGTVAVEIPVDPVIMRAARILQHRADRQVEWAVKRGEMHVPHDCTKCGKPFTIGPNRRKQIYAYHFSFSPDLRPGQETEWLCVRCKAKKDRELGSAARGILFDKRFTPSKLRYGGGFRLHTARKGPHVRYPK